jgi:hypothetical protein
MRSFHRAIRRAAVGTLAGALVLGLSATTASATVDAPNTLARATATTGQNTWTPEVLSKVDDVDVYRYRTTVTGYVRVLLGDLKADYRLRLLNATGRLIATSDRGGRGNEEIYVKLTAGTYYAQVDAPHGAVSASPYVVRFSSLPEGLVLLSKHEYGSGASRELDFEVLNNTSSAIEGVGWRIKDLASTCVETGFNVCTPYEAIIGQNRVIPPRARATFFTGAVTGLSKYSFTVSAGPRTTYSSKLSIAVTSTKALAGGRQSVAYTWANKSTHDACAPTPIRNSYDARGGLLAQTEFWWQGLYKPGSYSGKATVSAPPAGTVRTQWTVVEHRPDIPC